MDLLDDIKKEFPSIEEKLSEETIQQLIECDYDNLHLYHFGLGMWIRNNLLTDKSRLFMFFRLNGIDSLDDMSMLMIQLFYFYMRDKYTDDKTYRQFLDFRDFVCYTERKSKFKEFWDEN